MKIIITGLMIAIGLCGCATQTVEQINPAGVSTKYRTTAFFNKTAMTGTILGKETKTTKQLFGQQNSQNETQAESISAFFDGINGMVENAIKAGIKGAATGGLVP